MRSCDVCGLRIQPNWSYCPKCGGKIGGVDYPTVKLNYMWERERSGQFIHDNFKIVGKADASILDGKPRFRSVLGYFVNMNFYNIRKFSLLSISPKFALELYKLGKLTGYYDGEALVREKGIQELKDKLCKTERFLDIFQTINENGLYQEAYSNLGCGIIGLKSIDAENKKLTYIINEDTNYSVKSTRRICYEDLGALCGIVEAVTDRFFSGTETKCHSRGDEHCEFEIYQTKKEENPEIDAATKEEAEEMLDSLIQDAVHRRHTVNRKTLGDNTYIAYDQVTNYLLTHSTKGHEALTKYCGQQVGAKIAEEAGLKKAEEAIDYIKDLFAYMKAGLIEADTNGKTITVKMRESVYSSGVKNINMKLDTYTAGILQGTLKQTTKQNWQTEETKCTANGNEHCEIKCETK